jgi:hypothetical protein
MVLQYVVRPSVVCLQSKKFVARFLTDQTIPINFRSMFFPDFSGAHACVEQPLIFAAHDCFGG